MHAHIVEVTVRQECHLYIHILEKKNESWEFVNVIKYNTYD